MQKGRRFYMRFDPDKLGQNWRSFIHQQVQDKLNKNIKYKMKEKEVQLD